MIFDIKRKNIFSLVKKFQVANGSISLISQDVEPIYDYAITFLDDSIFYPVFMPIIEDVHELITSKASTIMIEADVLLVISF
jgi:hypothetical protein